MDESFDLQQNNQTQFEIPNFELPSLEDLPQEEEEAQPITSENGAVLSKLEWLNREAEACKNKLTVAFGGESGESSLFALETKSKLNEAFGGEVAASSLQAESYATRLSISASESTTAVSSVSQRDAGATIGGALINGAFALIENYQNLENNQIGGSRAIGNVFGEAGNGFGAGATGVMFGAAIGGVIPGAGTDVSGVLGFVSGIVVGVDVDQGLRWLGTSRM